MSGTRSDCPSRTSTPSSPWPRGSGPSAARSSALRPVVMKSVRYAVRARHPEGAVAGTGDAGRDLHDPPQHLVGGQPGGERLGGLVERLEPGAERALALVGLAVGDRQAGDGGEGAQHLGVEPAPPRRVRNSSSAPTTPCPPFSGRTQVVAASGPPASGASPAPSLPDAKSSISRPSSAMARRPIPGSPPGHVAAATPLHARWGCPASRA